MSPWALLSWIPGLVVVSLLSALLLPGVVKKVRRERAALKALRRAAQRFVMKVDNGRAISRRSYREFKAALELLEEGKSDGRSN